MIKVLANLLSSVVNYVGFSKLVANCNVSLAHDMYNAYNSAAEPNWVCSWELQLVSEFTRMQRVTAHRSSAWSLATNLVDVLPAAN